MAIKIEASTRLRAATANSDATKLRKMKMDLRDLISKFGKK